METFNCKIAFLMLSVQLEVVVELFLENLVIVDETPLDETNFLLKKLQSSKKLDL